MNISHNRLLNFANAVCNSYNDEYFEGVGKLHSISLISGLEFVVICDKVRWIVANVEKDDWGRRLIEEIEILQEKAGIDE